MTILSTIANGQASGPAERAEMLFRQGREAMRRHEYREACDKFKQSDQLDPSPGTCVNWAICEEKLDRLAEALSHARWALDRLGTDDDRRPIAAALVGDLNRRVAHLTVRLAPGARADMRVFLDGQPLAVQGAEQTRTVDPGSHVLLVEEPSHQAGRLVVTLAEGESATRAVEAGPALPASREDVRPSESRESRTSHARRNVGYVMAGSAATGLVAATLLAALALGEHDKVVHHCPEHLCDPEGFDAANRGRTLVNVATVALGIVVANAAASAVLLWPGKPFVAPSVVPLPSGLELGLVQRF